MRVLVLLLVGCTRLNGTSLADLCEPGCPADMMTDDVAPSGEDSDLGDGMDAGSVNDAPDADDAGGGNDAGSVDAAGGSDAGMDAGGPGLEDLSRPTDLPTQVSCGVKINEIRTGTLEDANDEYVEIYNSCSTPIDLTKGALLYRSANNNGGQVNPDVTLANMPSTLIQPHESMLFASSQFAGSKTGTLFSNLSALGGGVAYVDAARNIRDSVAYGSVVANHNYLEGGAAPLPPVEAAPGKAIARAPNGVDSDDGAADFYVTTPSPGASNP